MRPLRTLTRTKVVETVLQRDPEVPWRHHEKDTSLLCTRVNQTKYEWYGLRSVVVACSRYSFKITLSSLRSISAVCHMQYVPLSTISATSNRSRKLTYVQMPPKLLLRSALNCPSHPWRSCMDGNSAYCESVSRWSPPMLTSLVGVRILSSDRCERIAQSIHKSSGKGFEQTRACIHSPALAQHPICPITQASAA